MTVETVTHARRAVADEGFVEDLVDPDHDRDDTGDARRYDAWFESPWGRYAWAVESRLVHAALEGSGGRLVLDVGCGTGRSSALLRSSGVHVVGIDPDAGMLGLARARVDSAILAGGERLPFRDHAFDTTVAVTVLEFVREPADVLAEMARVTRSPGRIIVGALNPHSAWGLWHRRELQAGPWTGARFLSGRDLVQLGRAHGMVALDQGLRAPGWLPGLARWGPVAERSADSSRSTSWSRYPSRNRRRSCVAGSGAALRSQPAMAARRGRMPRLSGS